MRKTKTQSEVVFFIWFGFFESRRLLSGLMRGRDHIPWPAGEEVPGRGQCFFFISLLRKRKRKGITRTSNNNKASLQRALWSQGFTTTRFRCDECDSTHALAIRVTDISLVLSLIFVSWIICWVIHVHCWHFPIEHVWIVWSFTSCPLIYWPLTCTPLYTVHLMQWRKSYLYKIFLTFTVCITLLNICKHTVIYWKK